MSNEHYDATARGYLGRARECLLRHEPAYLFYAALELRFCVEERQDSYVQAQRRYIKSVPRAHKIGQQAAALKRIFSNDHIFQVTLDFYDIPAVALHFTPVTLALQKSRREAREFVTREELCSRIDRPVVDKNTR